MTINRFEDAYAIVQEVDSPLVGVTLDQYHFHAMASEWAALEKADGKKRFFCMASKRHGRHAVRCSIQHR
ncbi:hypothetical protein GCM10020331_091330 [Ectobacillus funiculus]